MVRQALVAKQPWWKEQTLVTEAAAGDEAALVEAALESEAVSGSRGTLGDGGCRWWRSNPDGERASLVGGGRPWWQRRPWRQNLVA